MFLNLHLLQNTTFLRLYECLTTSKQRMGKKLCYKHKANESGFKSIVCQYSFSILFLLRKKKIKKDIGLL